MAELRDVDLPLLLVYIYRNIEEEKAKPGRAPSLETSPISPADGSGSSHVRDALSKG